MIRYLKIKKHLLTALNIFSKKIVSQGPFVTMIKNVKKASTFRLNKYLKHFINGQKLKKSNNKICRKKLGDKNFKMKIVK